MTLNCFRWRQDKKLCTVWLKTIAHWAIAVSAYVYTHVYLYMGSAAARRNHLLNLSFTHPWYHSLSLRELLFQWQANSSWLKAWSIIGEGVNLEITMHQWHAMQEKVKKTTNCAIFSKVIKVIKVRAKHYGRSKTRPLAFISLAWHSHMPIWNPHSRGADTHCALWEQCPQQ